ncbi:MAG: SEL1-like repeat protein, partial [Alphaproteobacteria bacterium]|nr:SEL1-like repeat protein [Alphaproteobacteria bacterium]
MADDGSWPKGAGSETLASGEARTRQALGELRGVLGELERRLAASGPLPLPPETAAALIRTLEALTRRMARHETGAQGRARELAAALGSLSQYLDAQAGAQAAREEQLAARLDLVLSELAQVRAAQAAPRPDPGPIRVILAAAGAAAALSVVGAGVLAVTQPQALPRLVAAPLAAIIDLPLRPSLKAAPSTKAPVPVRGAQPIAVAPAGDSFAAVSAALKAGDTTALPRLTGLAQAGDTQAQLQLAALYEGGQAGLARDLIAARLWTRRAAEGGERVAMHNLGLFLTEGDGGSRDVDEAAVWFRRAADRGVVDSQYNLGLLYEAGRGVGRNLREAYRWYAIAANAGDTVAREKQVELEARLKPAERAALDVAVAAGCVPNAVTDAMFDELKRHYGEE